jgi:hypothetical protein
MTVTISARIMLILLCSLAASCSGKKQNMDREQKMQADTIENITFPTFREDGVRYDLKA